MAKVLICQYLLDGEYYCSRYRNGNVYKERCTHTLPHHKEYGKCRTDTCSDNYCDWVEEKDIKPIIFRAMIEGKI
jgi:hypothetical protein